MPADNSPRQGSLVVAALIVLGLMFAGHWIVSYVTESDPWVLLPWYGVAAAVIIVFGIATILRRVGDD
jgi:FtsH-binding integral membrane protein